MSDLTPCNRCTLTRIRAHAAEEGRVVTTRPATRSGELGGVDVHEHAAGEEPSDRNWFAWFWELPEACAC